jgi:hypothetical protein
MKAMLKLDVGGKSFGLFPIKDPGELKKEPQVIHSLAGYRIEVSAWEPTVRLPKMQAMAMSMAVNAAKPKPIRFSVIGKKPGSQVIEELGVMTVGETFSIPAGTHVIKVERIREDDHVQDG